MWTERKTATDRSTERNKDCAAKNERGVDQSENYMKQIDRKIHPNQMRETQGDKKDKRQNKKTWHGQ